MTDTEKQTDTPTYAQNYKVLDYCLVEVRNSKQGPYDRKLCNFTPWIVSEVTLDDGMETTTRIRLRGVHQSGRVLPEIEIPADELGNFNWVAKHWGINCILEVGQNVKDSIRYAIQTTAQNASRRTVYAVTGWKQIDGQWQFLMPGDETTTVHLPGKMRGYRMERECSALDIQTAECMLRMMPAPEEITLPLLAFTFLTPLNHFLKLAGCEPKFVLFLVGKTGSRKSTLAALFLSFFGRFTGAELPLSFRDTANSILHNAFTLKDVLTCIDDFHPAGKQEEQKLTATAQSIMRAYGDRTGKGRLRADSTPMDSRPPQGNTILTAEFSPDIGESGTARYFALELRGEDVDLPTLTAFQNEADKGTLRNCMYGYLEWLKETFLCSDDMQKSFIAFLQSRFLSGREEFQKSGILCHGRVPETVSLLQLGMDMLLLFLKENSAMDEESCAEIQNRFKEILYRLARKQADSIVQDKPTYKFIRKLYALLESGQVCVLSKNQFHDFVPNNCIGYEDDVFFYLHSEIAHRAVKKLCEEQGESFSVSSKFIAATQSQTSGGLRGTLRYCCREEKTAYEGRHLVTGVNCVAKTAYQEFMNTKRMFDKNDGRMFYHMIQSFKPGEDLTPQTAHEIALKMAEQFPGIEILVATHTDREHIHSHFIINSVNADTGKKYHSNLESLQQLREVSDQLCLAYGLSVIQPKHRKTPGMSAREYRSADKGQSWKLQLAITIEDAMTMARSRGHFISLMELEGYHVRWSEDRKHITYTDPQGHKCRDIRLHEEKYRKENMEREFRIRSQILGRNESQTAGFVAAGGESTSLRRRDRTQLGSDDRLSESPDRDAGGDSKYADDPDHQSGTDRFSEPAANRFDGEWHENQRNDAAVPGADDGCGGGADSADGDDSYQDAVTGWEDQRAVFEAALGSHTAAETLYEEAVLDLSDPQFAPADFGMHAAHLAANLSSLIQEDRPVEDCTTKHYQLERKNHHGHTMGGM